MTQDDAPLGTIPSCTKIQRRALLSTAIGSPRSSPCLATYDTCHPAGHGTGPSVRSDSSVPRFIARRSLQSMGCALGGTECMCHPGRRVERTNGEEENQRLVGWLVGWCIRSIHPPICRFCWFGAFVLMGFPNVAPLLFHTFS